MLKIIWPGDEPNRPVRNSAENFGELEADLRAEPWNPPDEKEFRNEMTWRARLWSGKNVPTGGTSEADAGEDDVADRLVVKPGFRQGSRDSNLGTRRPSRHPVSPARRRRAGRETQRHDETTDQHSASDGHPERPPQATNRKRHAYHLPLRSENCRS